MYMINVFSLSFLWSFWGLWLLYVLWHPVVWRTKSTVKDFTCCIMDSVLHCVKRYLICFITNNFYIKRIPTSYNNEWCLFLYLSSSISKKKHKAQSLMQIKLNHILHIIKFLDLQAPNKAQRNCIIKCLFTHFSDTFFVVDVLWLFVGWDEVCLCISFLLYSQSTGRLHEQLQLRWCKSLIFIMKCFESY